MMIVFALHLSWSIASNKTRGVQFEPTSLITTMQKLTRNESNTKRRNSRGQPPPKGQNHHHLQIGKVQTRASLSNNKRKRRKDPERLGSC
jgi:hypothetical protein